ncbi:uncharacterized protein TNIN_158911 [Trichonephila inaurata madagascariensis]|uniref:Uncharacterized protein n=1 Tax=Trichonephila inaurata madagascariensis TaxID=2747483 RepID=A0A8X7CMA4_9ARAC|nr:uncharacterized protein TNIN_158911 [Trichonephila inaurata madagascariensis]
MFLCQELVKDNSEGEKGEIILITHSNFNGDVSDLKDRVGNSQLCITIIRFVEDDSSAEESYVHLKDIFPCYSFHPINMITEDGESFEHFYNYMNANIPKPTYDYQIEEVTSWSMSSDNPLIIPMDPIASYFTLWLSGSVDSGSIQCKIGDANVMLEPKIRKSTISAYTFEQIHNDANDVSCVQKSASKPPLLTQVQKTSVKGHYFVFDVWYHDTTPSNGETQMPVIIYVKINYGGYPVVDANVTGIVTAPNDVKKEVQFFDNGKGDPDITKHDGLYSGYFTSFVDKGSHTLNVIVSYKESETMTGKKGADICCGSQVSSEMSDAPSFTLTKEIVIESKSKKPDDGYPPSRILDLKVTKFDPPTAITLGWTAPGGGEVASYILKLFNSREDALKNFESSGKVLDTTQITDSYYNKQENYEVNLSELEDNTTCYIALKALNEKKKASETSIILEFFLPLDDKQTSINPGTSPSPIIDDSKKSGPNKKTIGIVIGVLGGIVVVCICIYLGIYFLVQKPKRKEEKERAKRSQNGSDQRSSSGPSGQIGLNSIPADVIIKHHNEVVSAKNMHKDPPIFKEENLDSFNSSPELPENSNRNNNVAEYSQVQKASPRTPDASQQDPSKSPKRMTIV